MIRSRHIQNGQATTEVAVIAAAFVPLILVTVLMAKAGDIRHATEQASQYAVWEHVRNPQKPHQQIAAEIRARLFTRSQRPLATGESVQDTENMHRPYWSDHGNRPMLHSFSDVAIHTADSSSKPARRVFDLVAKPFLSGLGLNQRGLRYSTLIVPLIKQSSQALAPFDTLILEPRSTSVLMGDNWTAIDKEGVKSTVSSWKVTVPDPVLTHVVKGLAYIFHFADLEADPSSFENRNVDHDIVPCELRRRGRHPSC